MKVREFGLESRGNPAPLVHALMHTSVKRVYACGPASLMMVGTTATVALLRDGIELVVGSVGDSRALMCRKGKVRNLTDDHTPERKDEKHRYTHT